MNNWHEFKITTSTEKLADLGVDDSDESIISINLNTVSSFYKNVNDKTDEEMVSVMTIGGFRHDIYCTYKDFKKLIMS